jgi:excisionase family DNA binding protein
VNQRTPVEITPFNSTKRRDPRTREGGFFEQQFLQQLLTAVLPEIKALIKEVMADEVGQPLVVDYDEAGRMIGTTYEGIRKLVRKGKLKAVSRSGRHRGIALAELKDYVQRSQVGPHCNIPFAL